jgi:hypothetical protein
VIRGRVIIPRYVSLDVALQTFLIISFLLVLVRICFVSLPCECSSVRMTWPPSPRRSDDYLRREGIPIDMSIIEDLLADATQMGEGTDR